MAAAGPGRLVRALAEIPGLARIRYTTSHPRDMGDDLIAAHRDMPALMPFLHLPVQSGSDRMLAAMNRRHTADDYRRLVDRLRDARPDLALSSDFIVGHPGETDADHAATHGPGARVGFAQAFSLQILAPARHPGRRRAGPGAGGGEGRPAAGTAGAAARQPGRVQRRQRRAGRCPCWSPGPAAARASSAAARPPCSRCIFSASHLIGRKCRCRSRRHPHIPFRNALQQELAPLDTNRSGPRRDHAARPPRPAVTMQFDDNALLPLLLGDHDRHLVRLEQGLGVRLACRGNRVSISGDPARVEAAQAALGGLWQRLERRRGRRQRRRGRRHPHEHARPPSPTRACRCPTCRPSAPGAARSGRARPARRRIWTCWPARDGVRHRPGRHRQDLPRRGPGGGHAAAGRVERIVLSRPAVEAGRAARLPARRHEGEGRPVPAPPVRRAGRHDARRPGDPAHRHRGDRGRAARLHARPHPGPRLRHPGRGAEHHAGADEDVPHPHGRGHPHGRSPATSARSTCRRAPARACATRWTRWRACRGSASIASTCATWCAIRWLRV